MIVTGAARGAVDVAVAVLAEPGYAAIAAATARMAATTPFARCQHDSPRKLGLDPRIKSELLHGYIWHSLVVSVAIIFMVLHLITDKIAT